MTYEQYKIKVRKHCKEYYNMVVDFDTPAIEKICQDGYDIGSFPYYVGDRIAEQTD